MANNIFYENLQAFGLTRIEATIYESLLLHGSMTGYEIAKETGISRSNIYSALSSLVEKGAAYTMQGEASKFVPVKINVFLQNTLKDLQKKSEIIIQNAPKPLEEETGYITIKGERNIKHKINQMLSSTELRLYIMANSQLISEYSSLLYDLYKAGKKIIILTDKGILEDDDCALLRKLEADSAVYITESPKQQLRLITDSKYVLTGELCDSNNNSNSDNDTCLYSGQENLVTIMKEALSNKITLLKQEN